MIQPLDWGHNVFDGRMVRDMKEAEGLRLKAYQDTEGYWTVGYGHKVSDDKSLDCSAMVITNDEADRMFMEDLKIAREAVLTFGFTGVAGARMNALIELVFNMGLKGLKTFKHMLAAFTSGDYSTAAKELLNSKWAAQVGPTRSARIAALIDSGTYPS